jgi:hypothetical protein
VEADHRMRGTAWFNAAVAHYNLQRREEARMYAQRVVDDPRFADRARALIARLETDR